MSCTTQISVHVLDLHSAVTGSMRQTQEVREDEREEATRMSTEKHEREGAFPSFTVWKYITSEGCEKRRFCLKLIGDAGRQPAGVYFYSKIYVFYPKRPIPFRQSGPAAAGGRNQIGRPTVLLFASGHHQNICSISSRLSPLPAAARFIFVNVLITLTVCCKLTPPKTATITFCPVFVPSRM